ncbi:MAG: hypothetical protein EXQ60_01980 [Candidatus Nanopelagicales bacterium]|nr:hypothetical protein [Candidatus Nanopelagicales bacterium]
MIKDDRTPPGWPRGLPPPGTSEFADRVVPWLLDQGPQELRSSALRTLPLALVRYLVHYTEGGLNGARRAYGQARVELSQSLTPAEVVLAQQVFEAQGARFLQMQRELGLVEMALTRWPLVTPWSDDE